MSESTEVATARRNLLLIASTVLVIEVAGATVKSINAPGVTIDIKRPELIIYFLYAILAYSVFRFWQLAKQHHNIHNKHANQFLNRKKSIIRFVEANMSGVEGAFYNENNPSISRGIFKRELSFSGHAEGRSVSKGPIKVPYLTLLLPEVIADIRAIPVHKDFIEYTFPLLYAYFVMLIKCIMLFATTFIK